MQALLYGGQIGFVSCGLYDLNAPRPQAVYYCSSPGSVIPEIVGLDVEQQQLQSRRSLHRHACHLAAWRALLGIQMRVQVIGGAPRQQAAYCV